MENEISRDIYVKFEKSYFEGIGISRRILVSESAILAVYWLFRLAVSAILGITSYP